MKTLKLKSILSAVGIFALSSAFAQVDSAKSTTPATSTDTQLSTMTRDSSAATPGTTGAMQSVPMDHSTMDNSATTNSSATSDSTTAQYNAGKKMKKSEKKEGKAAKKVTDN